MISERNTINSPASLSSEKPNFRQPGSAGNSQKVKALQGVVLEQARGRIVVTPGAGSVILVPFLSPISKMGSPLRIQLTDA